MTDLNAELRAQLLRGATEMSVALNETQIEKLLAYVREFEKWNKAYNLSAVRDIRQMVARHLLDSLSVVPWFTANKKFSAARVIDVGTGGGLPGIPLAIMFPEQQFTLLDSNGKKTRFLFHVKTLLGLSNVSVENRRVEEFKPEQKFDVVISRAFASLQDMTDGCTHLLVDKGFFLAMKGLFPQDELAPIADKIALIESVKLLVAETDGERHLLVLQPQQ
ncbi:16S rRNA (guanine(527)-N(7))-methyltransferase RsmG [Cellvibrio sp. KY-YJ-3]|uniref:16S rRNA (guanine(527)-N(7))-methyltransferase RsmG n=1 Tax=Cellvibrio sp. KY-YJ-3 TaxID=454662 RepID=UPI001245FC71|nr:16S rRNA (guanine(527)-N(7))-methyltransferase RsmG [Cellvibrio sp. KY-YJ-3]QEY11482.1 16S rRNA (guanine(527)-N(7))-methyltransferase RsmG [Cellvibrio sp. KY-YJ-3]